MPIHGSLLELVGNTPMVRLARYAEGCGADIVAKMEMFNPMSLKDRPVLRMIEEAERDGRLKNGSVIEATSGNTGIALAWISAIKGYRLRICMSEIQSIERRQVLKAFGAELELTPREKGTKGSKEHLLTILEKEPDTFYVEQHGNPANAMAHQEGTAEEIWRDTEGGIDVLVAGIGTGGTAMGIARALRKRKPGLRVIGIEPFQAPVISQGVFSPHRLMGTAPGIVPSILDKEEVDEWALVKEEDAFSACRRLARTEGIFAGISSGATAHTALELANRAEYKGKMIVCIFADNGERYLSVDGLWDPGEG